VQQRERHAVQRLRDEENSDVGGESSHEPAYRSGQRRHHDRA
jgi:hypothetical protein